MVSSQNTSSWRRVIASSSKQERVSKITRRISNTRIIQIDWQNFESEQERVSKIKRRISNTRIIQIDWQNFKPEQT
jgi:hypothetical protein